MPKREKLSDYINELTLYYSARLDQQQAFKSKIISLLFWWLLALPILFIITISYSFILLVFPRATNKKDNVENISKICIARSFATSNKLHFLSMESVVFFSDKPFNKTERMNIYNLPFTYRVASFIRSISIFFKDFSMLSTEVSKYLSWEDSFRAFKLYVPRFPHKVSFTAYFYETLRFYTPNTVVTGNKEDRFALSEQSVCRAMGIELVCYPHGLEYAIKLPRGVVGDTFYCYSNATKKYYDEIYNTFGQKFIYSSDIVEKLLGRKFVTKDTTKRVVFFPESRGKAINLMILSYLLDNGVDLYLKLHPLDSAKTYMDIGLSCDKIIDDFNEAISGNIVLARKSTVLLEALYSGSASCAVLFAPSDKKSFDEQFPSLWDDRINQAANIDDLMQWLHSEIE